MEAVAIRIISMKPRTAPKITPAMYNQVVCSQ